MNSTNNRPVRSGPALLALVTGLVLAAPAYAQLSGAELRATGQISAADFVPVRAPQNLREESLFDQILTGNGTYDFTVGAPGAVASAFVQMDFGWARVAASATAEKFGSPGGSFQTAAARVDYIIASVSDIITIGGPGLTGTGTARLGVNVEGTLSASGLYQEGSGDAYAAGAASVAFRVPSADLTSSWSSGLIRSGDPVPDADLQEFLGGYIPFTFGTPFEIQFEIFLSAFADVRALDKPAVSGFFNDFRNTVTWAGVSDLQDALGQPVGNFTVSSLSGTDYRSPITASPVPLPATWLLLGTGVAVMSLRGRWRRQGPLLSLDSISKPVSGPA